MIIYDIILMIGYASKCFEFFGLVGWLRMILWCIVDSCDCVTCCLCWKGSTKALCEDKPARQQEIVLMTLEPPAPGPVWVLRVRGCAQQSFDHLMIWWAIFCTCGRINRTPKEAWFLQTRNYPRNYTNYILLPFPIFSNLQLLCLRSRRRSRSRNSRSRRSRSRRRRRRHC